MLVILKTRIINKKKVKLRAFLVVHKEISIYIEKHLKKKH